MIDFGSEPTPTPVPGFTRHYSDLNDSQREKFIDGLGNVSRCGVYIIPRSLIVNGDFGFAQMQVPGNATTYSNTTGRTMTADLWKVTNENASVQFKQVDTAASPETGLQARTYGKFVKITNTGKMIVSQAITGDDMMPLRGRPARFQVKMKLSVAVVMTVRLGLLYLTSSGTLDTLPATFASAFGAVTVDPTWGTNLAALAPVITEPTGTISGNGVTCVLGSTWARYSAVFNVPSNALNLIPVIYTHNQPVANDELNISEAGLYDGYEIMDWAEPPLSNEFIKIQRNLCKTFPLLTAPATNAGVTGALRFIAGKAGATAEFGHWRYPVQMRGTPAITLYNPSAANAQVRDVTAAADCASSAAASITDTCLDVNATGAAGTTVGGELKVHLLADASV